MPTPTPASAYLQLTAARHALARAEERLDTAFARHQYTHKITHLDMSDCVAVARRAAADDALARALEEYQQALRGALGTYSLLPLRPPF